MRPLIGTDLKRFLRDYRRAHKPAGELTVLLQSVEYPANVGSIFDWLTAPASVSLF